MFNLSTVLLYFHTNVFLFIPAAILCGNLTEYLFNVCQIEKKTNEHIPNVCAIQRDIKKNCMLS